MNFWTQKGVAQPQAKVRDAKGSNVPLDDSQTQRQQQQPLIEHPSTPSCYFRNQYPRNVKKSSPPVSLLELRRALFPIYVGGSALSYASWMRLHCCHDLTIPYHTALSWLYHQDFPARIVINEQLIRPPFSDIRTLRRYPQQEKCFMPGMACT